MEDARAMLHDQDLAMHLWAEATRTEVYVQTVLHIEYSRTGLLKKYSPERNQKSTISEYSAVLCTYTFQKKQKQKLDPSGKKGIFVGYSESSKAYRIYFPGFKKIGISRDVTFDEDTAYKKSRKKPIEEPEEAEAPKIHDTTMNEETQKKIENLKNHKNCRSTSGEESSQEETCLGTRSYQRCEKIWGSRRES